MFAITDKFGDKLIIRNNFYHLLRLGCREIAFYCFLEPSRGELSGIAGRN